jgi:heme oxygenase (biliverdin-IX-beta and delta-forming)
MLLATAPDDPTGLGIATSPGLRETLKEATAEAHRDLDTQFAAFVLSSRHGYRRFLEASAAALFPLEHALERAGVVSLFADWPQRMRREAIRADLARLDGDIRPLEDVSLLGRGGILGTMYVLEGSRLGAKYLLRMIDQSADPLIEGARAYLSHGSGQPLWRSFLTRLEREVLTGEAETEAVAGARQAFAMFAEAAARA